MGSKPTVEPTGFTLVIRATLVNFGQAFLSLFFVTGIPALYEVIRGLARGLSHGAGPDPNDLPLLLGIPLVAGTVIGGMTFLVYLYDYLSEKLNGSQP